MRPLTALRTGATLAGATALALAALLLPGSPAQALPLAPGTGWSGSWRYYTVDSFETTLTLPGVRFIGFGADNLGERNVLGLIEDTAADGRCARILIHASTAGYVSDRTVCGSGASATFSTVEFTGQLLILIQSARPDGTAVKAHYVHIPDSSGDPTLRTVDTGTAWSYYAPTAFQYTVTRPGVRIFGFGEHRSADTRSSFNTVEKSVVGAGCATGRTTATTGGPIVNSTCLHAGGFVNYSAPSMTGWIQAEGCYQPAGGARRCLTVTVHEPY